MQEPHEHIYFIFDPQFRDGDLFPECGLDIEQWKNCNTALNKDLLSAFSLWAAHDFINAKDAEEDIDDDDSCYYNDNCVGVYSKSHNSSTALRCANLPLYALNLPASANIPKTTIGYHVALPEHLSQRQEAWFDIFELPRQNNFVTTTLDEYHLLRHIKVLSSSHQITAIEAQQIPNPLADEVNLVLNGMPPSLSSVSPATARDINSLRTIFLQKMRCTDGFDDLYKLQSLANRHLMIRAERLNQIKALIYSDYYVASSRYLSDTHKIAPTWIQKRPIYDEDDLLYKECGVDGWFRSEYLPNTLLVALTALACVGYWSIDCDNDDSTELLTTASEGFVYAHQSDDGSNRRLYQIIYHPHNPFDLKKDLNRFNALMPVLAAICQEPISKGLQMATFFDDSERTKSLTDILLTDNGHESVIGKFIGAMADR